MSASRKAYRASGWEVSIPLDPESPLGDFYMGDDGELYVGQENDGTPTTRLTSGFGNLTFDSHDNERLGLAAIKEVAGRRGIQKAKDALRRKGLPTKRNTMTLRKATIRLAHENPALRTALLPLLTARLTIGNIDRWIGEREFKEVVGEAGFDTKAYNFKNIELEPPKVSIKGMAIPWTIYPFEVPAEDDLDPDMPVHGIVSIKTQLDQRHGVHLVVEITVE